MIIQYEDSDVLVIDKPAGMACFDGKSSLPTLEEYLQHEFPELESIPEHGICHRLDNNTSGLVLVAKNEKYHDDFRERFQKHEIPKTYLALVLGQVHETLNIDFPIAHHPTKKNRMLVCQTESEQKKWKGRAAHTSAKILSHFQDYTLLEITITSGVRHQIRVHLNSIGHPIAGDHLYQGGKRQTEDYLELNRHFLHASYLGFEHPSHKKFIKVYSELPPDLQEALDQAL